MALTKEIMATFHAEKLKERVKDKAAIRYLRIRALLDQADRLILEAQLPRAMKNKFIAKVERARRELDFGDAPQKISENLQDIVAILQKDVREASKIVQASLSSFKKDVEHMEKAKYHASSSTSQSISNSKSYRYQTNKHDKKTLDYSRAASGTMIGRAADAGDSVYYPRSITRSTKSSNPSGYSTKWGDSQTTENKKKMEVELSEECGTLDTLHYALRILNEMGRPDLTEKEVHDLETTMKKTKKMLLNRKACQNLREPLESLQQAMEMPPGQRDPYFSAALQSVHKTVNAYETIESFSKMR